MSRPADELRISEEDAVDREDYFDCQETLEHPDRDGRHAKTDMRRETLDDTRIEPLENTLNDSDDDLKERGEEVEDEHQKEEEEKLTEEEKESRRLHSLILKEEGNCHFKNGGQLEHHIHQHSTRVAFELRNVCLRRLVSGGAELHASVGVVSALFQPRSSHPVLKQSGCPTAPGMLTLLHQDRKDDGIADCSRALELKPDYLKALLRRAELYEQTEQLEKALDDYQKVLERDPGQAAARRACVRLPQQIHEKNEKLKEEMLGKLKELGNMVLRPFGLSTSNFQVNQDTNTGSYSINFVNKPNNT
ncbi:tetratricopeptide repeat protein 1 isoform X1 [Syngnathus typhle]|uniref:tetratricopeptide repeat protein 1 isoform X1 n=1 Tax=Syngnathus typhle TaxID=161592 RepID=UPI002A6A2D07|nr:tetratricopeptide repeat protein 1 isoform X1 [Syngnathus typhle]XP_061154874.1 tetratricopeptide repeat protein 1 isoform X1 [Syngnathus typhle]